MVRPTGTSERSTYTQLRLAAWLAISARSAALQPTWSSAIACFRVRGSGEACDTAKAHPVARPQRGFWADVFVIRRTGCRPRSGYSPRPRWKCRCCAGPAVESERSAFVGSVDGSAAAALDGSAAAASDGPAAAALCVSTKVMLVTLVAGTCGWSGRGAATAAWVGAWTVGAAEANTRANKKFRSGGEGRQGNGGQAPVRVIREASCTSKNGGAVGTTVSWVLENILSSRISGGAEEARSAAYQLVRLGKFTCV
eukprot:6212054-Pleurochrysis_carterae.AAC.1